MDRIKNSNVFLSDSFGKELKSISVHNQIQIVGTITNEQNFNQPFVYIFQVKDANDAIVSVSWVIGEINSNQILNISQSWVPSKPGVHLIEIFVWNSLGDPIPLSVPKSYEFFVE